MHNQDLGTGQSSAAYNLRRIGRKESVQYFNQCFIYFHLRSHIYLYNKDMEQQFDLLVRFLVISEGDLCFPS